MASIKKTGSRIPGGVRPAPYKIKEVSEITGVSRETIRYYINEGLLPPPEKSARNMGWYTQRHIDLLKLIQKLQREQFLPLKAIKSLVTGTSELEFSPAQETVLSQLRQKLSPSSVQLLAAKPAKARRAASRLSADELREFAEIGIQLEPGTSAADAELAELWARMRDNGINAQRGFGPRDLFYLVEIADLAVQQELRYFGDRVRTMSPDESTQLSDVVIPALSRIFALLHERRFAWFIQRHLEEHSAAGAAVVPPQRRRVRKRAD